jgi:hypothetical protein
MNSSTKSRHYNTEHRTSVEHEIKAKPKSKQNKTRAIKPTRVKRKERNRKGTRSAKKGLAPKWRLKEIERETHRDTQRERSTLEAIKRSSSATKLLALSHTLCVCCKKPPLDTECVCWEALGQQSSARAAQSVPRHASRSSWRLWFRSRRSGE